MSYSRKRVLVTGGTGFIGARLAERLAYEEGAEVRVLTRSWRSATWVARARVELVLGDVRDFSTLVDATRSCDVVFHSAVVAGAWETSLRTNAEGTENALRAAIQSGVERFVHVSSVAVHGPSPATPTAEGAPFTLSGDPYAYSKIRAEEAVWRAWETKRLEVSVVRPTFVYGPRSALFTELPVRMMMRNRWPLVDNGNGTCNAVYVDNLVDALMLAGDRAAAVGQAFLISDDLTRNWREFFGYYEQMLGPVIYPEIDSIPYRSGWPARVHSILDLMLVAIARTPSQEPARTATRIWRIVLRRARQNVKLHWTCLSPLMILYYAHVGRYDISLARRLLGYSPRVSLAEGMRQTEIWLRNQGIIQHARGRSQ